MEKPVPRAFDLGMIDFVESTAFEKEKENRFRPLSLKKSRSNAPPPKRPCLHPSENQAWLVFQGRQTTVYERLALL